MPRRIHFADLFIAGGAIAVTTVALLAWATRIDVQLASKAARLAALDEARVTLTTTLAELEQRNGEDAALRQVVARRVEDLQARFPARFSTALDQASRARPKGVWLTRFYWTGAEVKAEGQTWGPALASEFAGRLARSPHFVQVFTAPAERRATDAAVGPERFLLFARAVAR
jgi:hypothetical protein